MFYDKYSFYHGFPPQKRKEKNSANGLEANPLSASLTHSGYGLSWPLLLTCLDSTEGHIHSPLCDRTVGNR